MTNLERDVLRKLTQEHGLKYLYPEKIFYKTHKMTRAEFLKRLENAKT